MNFDNKIKQMIGKKKFGGRNDWDGDGVPNKKDCQPRNTMRQDARTQWFIINWNDDGARQPIKAYDKQDAFNQAKSMAKRNIPYRTFTLEEQTPSEAIMYRKQAKERTRARMGWHP